MAEGTASAKGVCRIIGAEMRPRREQEGARCEMRVERVAGTRPHGTWRPGHWEAPKEIC